VYVSAAAGVLFMVVHAVYAWVRPKAAWGGAAAGAVAATLPAQLVRHGLGARLFHWVMAAAILALLVTAFLPIVGVQFAWVTLHWMAGVVLVVSVLYHILHTTVSLDVWSIWPTRLDLEDASNRFRRAVGGMAPVPRKPGKYPLNNKLYHAMLVLSGVVIVVTGLCMMVRVETPLWTRNPYLFRDETWGVIYVLHGLGGIALVALTVVHLYFALRPGNLWVTKAMIVGSISRRDYLDHHDPLLWVIAKPGQRGQGRKAAV
jgi:cytochrome b subunit of formate dehydrogenase